MAETRSGRPVKDEDAREVATTTKRYDGTSIAPRADNPAHDVPMVLHRTLVGLIGELRADLPAPIIETLVVEALDASAGEVLDLAWARTREHLYGEAVAAARSARVRTPYAQRRAAELRDAQPRRGDFRGVRHLRSVGGGAA